MNNFFDFKLDSLQGKPDVLGTQRGNVVLAVNVASKCGLTPQYTGLEQLQDKLVGRGFSVVGFPCNQFGGQEPGSAQEIAEFCSSTYGVSFPLSEKLEVNGASRAPLYDWLTAKDNGYPGDITWNFEKFLIGRDGKVLKRYSPRTTPDDPGLQKDIEAAL
ncbi:MAG: glutathione peroxidase [Steroidobacteraceae bacterium]